MCYKTGCRSAGLKPNIYFSFGQKKKHTSFQKILCSPAWNLHQHSSIAFNLFSGRMNYVCGFIIQLHLWILHLCIQWEVQEMSQIIRNKLNQLQIQIMYLHYAVIRRLCVYVMVCMLWLCLGFFLAIVPAL